MLGSRFTGYDSRWEASLFKIGLLGSPKIAGVSWKLVELWVSKHALAMHAFMGLFETDAFFVIQRAVFQLWKSTPPDDRTVKGVTIRSETRGET